MCVQRRQTTGEVTEDGQLAVEDCVDRCSIADWSTQQYCLVAWNMPDDRHDGFQACNYIGNASDNLTFHLVEYETDRSLSNRWTWRRENRFYQKFVKTFKTGNQVKLFWRFLTTHKRNFWMSTTTKNLRRHCP